MPVLLSNSVSWLTLKSSLRDAADSNFPSDLGALGLVCPPLPSYVGRLVEFYRAHRDGVRRSAMV